MFTFRAVNTSRDRAASHLTRVHQLFLVFVLTTGAATAQSKAAVAEAVPKEVNTDSSHAANADVRLRLKESLAAARTLGVRSKTVWVKRSALENALLNKKAFLDLGIDVLDRAEGADVRLDIDHVEFTTRFTYTLVDQQSGQIIAAGRVSSLFGSVAGKISGRLAKQIREARAAASKPATK